MTLESKAAFARRIGVNKSTITRAAQAGRLVLDGEMVDVEQSLARWHATQGGRTDVAARHAAQRGQAIPALPTPCAAQENAVAGLYDPGAGMVAGMVAAQPDAQPEGADTDGGIDRTAFKAMALRYENEAIKLEMALRRHLRYPLEDVRREAQALGMTLRAGVERLIDQTAPRLAAMTGTAEREALLRAEVAALGRAFRAEFKQSLRRLRQQRKGTN